ncbi:MAG: hypothetical protein SF182_08680 [Deltaproteobacteria bacterium]|nr:hypothetical protein [Deltaproteobacteria bacterium]
MTRRAAVLMLPACRTLVAVAGLLCLAAARDVHAQAPTAVAATDAATPAAAESPTADATDVCGAAVKALGNGDSKPLKALPPALADRLTAGQKAAEAFTCLAVAEGSAKSCDRLPQSSRAACEERTKFLLGLKSAPKEALKAQIIHTICLQEGSKEDCAKLKQAIATRNPAACQQLSQADGAWGREGLCAALASGDAAKCSVVPEGEKRDTCAAMATDDAKRCPKGSADCVAMVGNFAVLSKGGLDGEGLDPTTAALRQGRKACAPLLEGLADACK